MNTLLLSAPSSEIAALTRFIRNLGFETSVSQDKIPEAPHSGQDDSLEQLNRSLLDSVHSNWYHISHIQPGTFLAGHIHGIDDRKRAVAEYIEKQQNWICNDPTMCLLLPEWRNYLSKLLVIIYVDQPVSVALSLKQKWGFPLAFGVALWEYYIRSSLINSVDLPRIIIHHHSFLSNTSHFADVLSAKTKEFGSQNITSNQDDSYFESIRQDIDTNDNLLLQYAEFICGDQLALYNALADISTDVPNVGNMSSAGQDILEGYGRVRAGLYFSRKEYDKLTTKTAKLEQESANSPTQYTSELQQSISVVVSVKIQDMEQVEFQCNLDSPVLNQLLEALLKKSEDPINSELFHLQFGETALYFSISRLLSVEIEEDQVVTEGFNGSRLIKPIHLNNKPKRIAIVVLGCLIPVYENAINIIQNTWGSRKVHDVDVYYTLGGHLRNEDEREVLERFTKSPVVDLNAFGASQYKDIIVCGCADSIQLQTDCLLRKRLITFQYLIENYDYDYIYTVCASSYVDQIALTKYVSGLEGNYIFHGPAGVCQSTNFPYISGASMLFSRDLIEQLVQNKCKIIEENESQYADDVAVGNWIANNISQSNRDTIVEKLRRGKPATSDNTFVVPGNCSMIDYVNVPVEEQKIVDNVYHYHFKTDDIEQMVSFDRGFS